VTYRNNGFGAGDTCTIFGKRQRFNVAGTIHQEVEVWGERAKRGGEMGKQKRREIVDFAVDDVRYWVGVLG
jgi:hypothetical protein